MTWDKAVVFTPDVKRGPLKRIVPVVAEPVETRTGCWDGSEVLKLAIGLMLYWEDDKYGNLEGKVATLDRICEEEWLALEHSRK